MMLKSTATASLALPSAVSVSWRVQSQQLHFGAPLGNKLPQYGHGIVYAPPDCCSVGGASVYSTFVKLSLTRRARFVKKTGRQKSTIDRANCQSRAQDIANAFARRNSRIHKPVSAHSGN